MATPAQDQARLRALVRAQDQELERALSQATRRTLSAVHKLVRSQARSARRVCTAWRRPPPAPFRKQFGPKRGYGLRGSGGPGTTFHFHLNRCYTGRAGAQHQSYIEREEAACVSFGNICEEFSERKRVWEEIEARGGQRKGSITIDADADRALREAVIERLSQWAEEGRVPRRMAGALTRLGATQWPQKGLRVWTHDDADHQRLAGWLREWESAHQSQAERVPAESEDDTPSVPEQPALPGFEQTHPGPSEAERGRHAKSLREKASRTRKLPRGTREFAPRRTLVQRRIIFELAHELPLEAQERALARWCEQELAAHGISYHAVIHQPEGQNDPRNWHAHIVYAPITLEREVGAQGTETGRFTFEAADRLPPMPTRLRVLGGNGPQGRRGASKLVQEWRKALADIQNVELRRVGTDKRYDPRSYRDMGLDKVAGQHVGTKRAAIEGSGRAVEHWSQECPEWRQVMSEIESRLENCSATDSEREGVMETIEEVRLEMGAHLPEAEPERRAWGLRLRSALRSEPSATGTNPEGWQPEIHALADRIRKIGRSCTTMTPPAKWQLAWRAAKGKFSDPLRLGAVADGIAKTFPGGADGLASDPRPEARTIAAKARRYRTQRARWETRYAEAHAQGDDAVERLAVEMARKTVPAALVLGSARGQIIDHHVQRHVERKRLRETIRNAAEARGRESAHALAARNEAIDWTHAQTLIGERITTKHRQGLRRAIAVTALREAWGRACAAGIEGVEAFSITSVRHRHWPNNELDRVDAVEALGREELRTLVLSETDPAQALARWRESEQLTNAILARLNNDPRFGERLEADTDAMKWLDTHAPPTAAAVREHARTLNTRRRRLTRRLARAGIEPDRDPQAAARRCAALTPEGALSLALVAPELLRTEHPKVWQAINGGLRTWAKRMASDAKTDSVEARWCDEAHARVLDELANALPAARRAAAQVRENLRKAQGATDAAKQAVASAVRTLRAARTPVDQARARKGLAAVLADATIREAIGEHTARAIGHEAGLRDREESAEAAAATPRGRER